MYHLHKSVPFTEKRPQKPETNINKKPSKKWNKNFLLEHSDWELRRFPVNQSFRILGNSGERYINFAEKFPEIPGEKLNGKKTSGKKFPKFWYTSRGCLFWGEILVNSVPFATGRCRKLKPDVLVERKAPRTSFSDVPLLPEANRRVVFHLLCDWIFLKLFVNGKQSRTLHVNHTFWYILLPSSA